MYVSALDPDRHLSIFNLKSTPFPDTLAVFIDSYHTDPRSTALKLLLWPRADPLLTLLKVRGTAPGYHSVISSSADKSKPWNPASSCKHPLILSFLGRQHWTGNGKGQHFPPYSIECSYVKLSLQSEWGQTLADGLFGSFSHRGLLQEIVYSPPLNLNMNPRCIKHAVRT